jgi:histidine triad (HIT) family protein
LDLVLTGVYPIVSKFTKEVLKSKEMNGKSDCVFCKIVKGEIPAYKIWEDKRHLAVLDIFPNTPGFTVVLTKRHLPSYAFENSDEVLKKLIIATKKVSKLLDRAFEDVGRTGMFFEGFGVDHLHSKLFPMHGSSNLRKWEKIEAKDSGPFYKKYPGFLSSRSSSRADDKILAKIADKIRSVKL